MTALHAPATPRGGIPWATQPASTLGWLALLLVVLIYALGSDRTFFTDQLNYLEYFAQAPSLEWLNRLFTAGSLQTLVVAIISEEVLWQGYAAVLGSVLSPGAAVYFTVAATSVLLALAVLRVRDPVLPMLLWIMLPVGFAVTGLLQLRQGFAFAVLMYVALRWERPVLGALLAAMLHTTFALVLPFALIARLWRRYPLLALLVAVSFAFGVAYVGGMLFELFGGRRLQIYSVEGGDATSIFYVFGAWLCSLPSLHRLVAEPIADESPQLRMVLDNLAVVHVGVIAFVSASFFIFPLGAGRIGYLVMLLLIPILPSMRPRTSVSAAGIYSLLCLYLIYLTVKTGLEGTYGIYVTG